MNELWTPSIDHCEEDSKLDRKSFKPLRRFVPRVLGKRNTSSIPLKGDEQEPEPEAAFIKQINELTLLDSSGREAKTEGVDPMVGFNDCHINRHDHLSK